MLSAEIGENEASSTISWKLTWAWGRGIHRRQIHMRCVKWPWRGCSFPPAISNLWDAGHGWRYLPDSSPRLRWTRRVRGSPDCLAMWHHWCLSYSNTTGSHTE